MPRTRPVVSIVDRWRRVDVPRVPAMPLATECPRCGGPVNRRNTSARFLGNLLHLLRLGWRWEGGGGLAARDGRSQDSNPSTGARDGSALDGAYERVNVLASTVGLFREWRERDAMILDVLVRAKRDDLVDGSARATKASGKLSGFHSACMSGAYAEHVGRGEFDRIIHETNVAPTAYRYATDTIQTAYQGDTQCLPYAHLIAGRMRSLFPIVVR